MNKKKKTCKNCGKNIINGCKSVIGCTHYDLWVPIKPPHVAEVPAAPAVNEEEVSYYESADTKMIKKSCINCACSDDINMCEVEEACIGFSHWEPKYAPAVPVIEPPDDTKTFKGEGGTHYKQDRIVETFLLMEQVASNIHSQTSDIRKALWAAMAMKHLDRVGTKEDVDQELLKAENYIHRARTGQWMDK